MARLSDIPKVYRSVGVVPFMLRVYDEMNKDNLLVWASALAYSWLFAIFPFFIFLLAVLQYLPPEARAMTKVEIRHMVTANFPSVANSMLWQDIDENQKNLINQPLVRGPMLYLGLFIALWVASGGTSMTMYALDRCYELERGRSFIHQRVVAMLLTIVVAVLLLVVMCLLPVATMFKRAILQQDGLSFPGAIFIFDLARWVLSIVLMLLVLTLVYYNGPDIRQHFCFITPGGAFVLIVWVVLGLIFRFYVDRMGARGYNQTYGTVGGVAILLFFFYVDALVLLIGAEINSEVDFEVLRVRRGTHDFRNAEDVVSGCPTSC